MLNKCFFQGRLGRDPELRRTGSGIAVASFSLAVDRDYKPEGGEREADWVNIIAFGKLGEFATKYFSKGRMAIVTGRLQVRPYTDKEGNKRTAYEIVAQELHFGDSKKDGNSAGGSPAYREPVPQAVSPGEDFQQLDDDDTLPF